MTTTVGSDRRRHAARLGGAGLILLALLVVATVAWAVTGVASEPPEVVTLIPSPGTSFKVHCEWAGLLWNPDQICKRYFHWRRGIRADVAALAVPLLPLAVSFTVLGLRLWESSSDDSTEAGS